MHLLRSMRMTALVLFAVFSSIALAADSASPKQTKFPQELKLTNGAVLRNARPERWENDYVVVRYVGGVDRVRYANISEAQRALVLACKEAAQDAQRKPELPIVAPATVAANVIEGQAFIVTRGAGNYKLGGMIVYLFPLDRLGAFDGYATVDLGEPTTTATTDADGKFKLKVPGPGDFFLFARGDRLAGTTHERYEWFVKSTEISDRSNVLLSSNNNREPLRTIRIGNETLTGMSTQLGRR